MSRYVDTTGLARQGGVAASAVEAELQRYVEEKGVNDLFINITEQCVPAHPAPAAPRAGTALERGALVLRCRSGGARVRGRG